MNDSKVAPVEAQAVPDQPVAIKPCPFCGGNATAQIGLSASREKRMCVVCQRCGASSETFCGEAHAQLLAAWNRRPTPAAADLHQQIMNLPCRSPQTHSGYMSAYNAGHRDARHAAAQLVAASPAAAAGVPTGWMTVPKSLITALGEYLETTPCDCSHKRRYEQGGHLSYCHLFDLDAAWNEWQALAASPVAPVGAPTETLREIGTVVLSPKGNALNITKHIALDAADIADGYRVMPAFVRQGCELATDATKQLREHSVHLAVNDDAEDFRMRPASSEAAPSAVDTELIQRTFWLIERGPNQGQSQTVWWNNGPAGVCGWKSGFHEATPFRTREEAERVVRSIWALSDCAITSHSLMEQK